MEPSTLKPDHPPPVQAAAAATPVVGNAYGVGCRIRAALGINAAVVACSLTLIAIIWSVVITQLQFERQETIAAAVRENSNLVKAFEEHATRTIKGVDAVARFLIYEYARLGAKLDIAQLIKNDVIDNTLFTIVNILDERGDVVTSSRALEAVDQAAGEYFTVHRQQDSGRLFIGKPVLDRALNQWAFQITRRINKADGSFGGVMSIGVDPAYFSNFYQRSDLGEKDAALLVGLDNIARVWHAGNITSFGRDMSNSTLLKEQRKTSAGSFLSVGRLEGVPRYMSYRTLADYPLLVAVGAAQEEVLAVYAQRKRQHYGYALLFSAVIVVFTALLMSALMRQRRSVALLAASENKLDNILSSLHEIVWSIDPHSGCMLYLNAAITPLTRRPVSDFLAQPRLWRSMVHRDDRASLRRAIRGLLHEGVLLHEFRIVLADGEARSVQCSARVRRDGAGKVLRIDGTLSDITARVRTDEMQRKHIELTRLQATLAAAANEAVTVAVAFQISLRLISDHGGWLIGHLTTFAVDDGLRRIVTSVWQIEDRDRMRFANLIEFAENFVGSQFKRFMQKVITEKVPVWIEDLRAIALGRRTGLALAAGLHRAFAFPVVVQNEVVAVLEFYAEDARPPDTLLIENISQVTAQLARVIERARASEGQSRLAAIVASSQDGIVSSTPEGKILTWNAGAEKMFGYTSKEIIGQNAISLTPDDLHQEVRQRRQRYLSGGSFEPYESERLTQDRRRIAVSVNAAPLKDESDKIVGIATIYRDITERKQAEAALLRLNNELEDKVATRTVDLQRARHDAEAASHAKSEFLAAMSHEIRTPMNGVIGMIDVLHQSSLKGDQVEMVELIRESAFSLLGLINDILDFSKIEAGKLALDQQPIAVAEVVESVCSLLNSMAEKKDVALTLYTDPAIPLQVQGDALRLRQVLINLVNNAIKFCSGQPRAGRVSVRALLVGQSAEQVTLEFCVIDNGIGMDDATQARLFTAFTQADTSTTRRFGGSGLGLAIVRHLVELMGGEITMQSTPGAGATLKVRLTFVPLPPQSPAIEAASAASNVAGLCCVVVGAAGGLADDLAVYLRHADALVERTLALVLADAKAQTVSRNGLSVWVIDACDERQPPEQIRAAARARIDAHVRLVVVLIERGKRGRPRRVAPDMICVDGNALNRRTFLKAVAVAAGRASLETETETEMQTQTGKPSAGKIAMSAPLRADALRLGRLILIAEDNETNQKVIVRQLALLGYAADVAADGRDALQRWHSGDYALLLTDLHMPQMDGYALAQAIRVAEKDGTRMPIIALTANALKGEAERCRGVGMDDYRSKPLPLAEIKAVLDQWLPAIQSAADTATLCGLTTPAVSPANGVAPVDVKVLIGLVGDDPVLMHEFLQDFRASAARIALELRAACVTSQTKAAAAAAHKLKSSALAVGALGLGELCSAIEAAGKAGDIQALTVLLPRFAAEMAAVEDYLARRSVNAAGAEYKRL